MTTKDQQTSENAQVNPPPPPPFDKSLSPTAEGEKAPSEAPSSSPSEIASPSAAPSASNTNTVHEIVFEVTLRRKDRGVPGRLRIAYQVAKRIANTIQSGFFFHPIHGDITLKIIVVACSAGNRCARIFCAETCVGWVILDCEWFLMRGDTYLTEPKTEKLRWSGMWDVQGLDACYENYGEYTLLNNFCYKMAERIATKAAEALNNL